MRLNTFDRAKLAQKFESADARSACCRCGYASKSREQVMGSWSSFQCMKGGFFVTPYAVCDSFQRKVKGAST